MQDTKIYKFTTHRTMECEYHIEAESEEEARRVYLNGVEEDEFDILEEKITKITCLEEAQTYTLTCTQTFRAQYAVEATSPEEAKSIFEANPGGHDIMHSELISEEVDTVNRQFSVEPAVFGGFRYLGDGEKAAQRAFAHEVDMLLMRFASASSPDTLAEQSDQLVAQMGMVFEHNQALWGVVDFDDPRFVKVELAVVEDRPLGHNVEIRIGTEGESATITYSQDLRRFVRIGDGTPATGYGLTNWGSVGRGDPQDM